MKYAAEMDLGDTIYLPRFIMIDSAIQKLIQGDTHTDIDTHTYTNIGR
jgi:hypothetical protein